MTVEDKKQKRVGIPQEFVDELKINKKDSFEFTLNKEKLSAKLKKDSQSTKELKWLNKK